jgi:hypothetical protein
MSNPDDFDDGFPLEDFVDDPVVADPNSISTFPGMEFSGAARQRIGG